jgi:exosortase A
MSPASSRTAVSLPENPFVSIAIERREVAPLLLIAGIAALVALVYADSFASMAEVWSYSGYRHGVVVFPISAYLLWRLRGSLAASELAPWPWGVPAVAGLVLLWWLGRAVGVQAAEHLAIVLLLPATIAACLGIEIVRRALFPLAFLVLAVPLGDALIPYLMRITADVSAALLRVVGVPVFREGQFITLPGGVFEVADVCSGLRYLVAGTMIGLLFAYLTYRSPRRRALFVAITAVSLILVNGVRAFIVMLVASATDLRWFAGEDHIYFGWVLFAVVIGALFVVGARYSDELPPTANAAAPAAAQNAVRVWPLGLVLGLLLLAITARPLEQHSVSIWWLLPAGTAVLWLASRFLVHPERGPQAQAAVAGASPYRRVGGALVVCLAAAALVAGPALSPRPAADAGGVAVGVGLPQVEGCTAARWNAAWQPEIVAPDFNAVGAYRCGGRTINAFIGGYVSHVQGKELVSEENRLLPEGWRRYLTEREETFAAASGAAVDVNEVRVDGGGTRSLIWYWYTVGAAPATDASAVKITQAVRVIVGGRTDGALYWLETTLEPDVAASRERLRALAPHLFALSATPFGATGGSVQ